MKTQLVLLVAVVAVVAVVVEGRAKMPSGVRLSEAVVAEFAPTSCPCSDPSLCNPIVGKRDFEIFGFGGREWQNMNWTAGVSTIAWAQDADVVCEAHKHGARVVAGVPNPMPLTANVTERSVWIKNTIRMAKSMYLDGVTFDYEDVINKTSPERDYYTALIQETTDAFHKEIIGSQVSVCVGWSPDNVDARDYDYLTISQVSDYLYVMMYDTRSQIYDRCIASANAPTSIAKLGIDRYLDLGIDKKKLILGLPFYSYDYTCEAAMGEMDVYCPIRFVPWRGVMCSDAAGVEVAFSDSLRIWSSANITSPMRWDDAVDCHYFNYRAADGVMHQVWMEDVSSLLPKYRVARSLDLGGMGPFTFDDLSYDTPDQQLASQQMWAALAQTSFD